MTAASGDDTPDAVPGPDASTKRRALRQLPLFGACVACCVPMLVFLGAVSIGAAVAGLVGLGLFLAVAAVAVVWVPRLRRGR